MYPSRIGHVHFHNHDAIQPLALPSGVFSPYNSQNTVHQRSAFWALYLPSSVSFRVTDIWRSFWAQRLLWETDGSVVFVSGTVDQVGIAACVCTVAMHPRDM